MRSTSTSWKARKVSASQPLATPGVTRRRGLERRGARLTPRKTGVARRRSSRGNRRRLRPSSVRNNRPGRARSCVSLQKSLSNVRLQISPRPAPRKRWLARVNGGLVEEVHRAKRPGGIPDEETLPVGSRRACPLRDRPRAHAVQHGVDSQCSCVAIRAKAWMVRPSRKGANRSKGPQRWKAPRLVYKLCFFTEAQHTQAWRLLSLQHHREGESSEETRVPDNGTRGNGRGDRGVRGSVRVLGRTWGKRKAPWEFGKNPRAFSRTRRSDLVAREAPGLRSSEAKPQSWFHAHRVKALTATTGSDTRYGYTYVRMLDGRNRSVVS